MPAVPAGGIAEYVAEVGIRHALEFGPGMILLLATPAFAPWLLTPRDVVRSGLAFGAMLPALVVTTFIPRDAMTSIVAFGLVIGAFIALAVAVRQSSEPARLRLASTSFLAGALLVGALATCLRWPVPFTMRGPGARVLPTAEVILAAALLLLGTFHLVGRRTRSLLWFTLAALAIWASPGLGRYSAGCLAMPGPLELTVFPVFFAAAIPLLWSGPAFRYLAPRKTQEALARRISEVPRIEVSSFPPNLGASEMEMVSDRGTLEVPEATSPPIAEP